MKTVLIIIIAFLAVSCSNKNTKIQSLDWMSGKWTADVNEGTMTETWTLKNDSTWVGESIFMKGEQLLFTEKISIILRSDKLVCLISVSDQNDGKEVVFVESERTDSKVVFENKAHDYPQKISYGKDGEDKMHAFVSGNMEGQFHKIDFDLKRVK
jgi:hypothetical protein